MKQMTLSQVRREILKLGRQRKLLMMSHLAADHAQWINRNLTDMGTYLMIPKLTRRRLLRMQMELLR